MLSERLQLPVANATSILHNPVELDAVVPRLCKGIIKMRRRLYIGDLWSQEDTAQL